MTNSGQRNAKRDSTEMETTATRTDEINARPAETYEPAPAPSHSAFDSWTPARIPGGRRLWTAALAAALLVSAAGIGLLYLDDNNNQATIRSLNSKNQSLTGRTQNLEDQLTVTQGKLTASQAQVDSLDAELKHPTLGVWNVPMTIHNSSQYLAATAPDTFTYHPNLNSTLPLNRRIL